MTFLHFLSALSNLLVDFVLHQKLERKAEIMKAVVHVFADMFEDEVDLYWMSFKFMKCLDQSVTQIEKLVTNECTCCLACNEGNKIIFINKMSLSYQ